MGSLDSPMGPLVLLKVYSRGSGLCGMLLGLSVCFTVIQARSHFADKAWLDSPTGDLSTKDPLNVRSYPEHLGLSGTAAPIDPDSAAVASSPDGPPLEPDSHTDAADRLLLQWGLSPSQNPKAFTSSDLLAERAVPRTTPPLRTSKPKSGPDSEGPTLRRLRDLSLVRNISIKTISKQPPLSNNPNVSALQSSLSASVGPFIPYPVLQDSDQKYADGQTQTSLHSSELQSPSLAVDMQGAPFDVSYSSDNPSPSGSPTSSASNKEQEEPPLGTNITNNAPPEILVPSYSPFFSPSPTSALSEPTEALPVDIFPTSIADMDWGSGEYMETMSYPEGDDYSPVSSMPLGMYDLEEESASESYDTSFPTRVGVSMSSYLPHPVTLSLSFTTVPNPAGSPAFVHPVPLSSSSSSWPAIESIPPVRSESVDPSGADWSDAFTVEATALLLPDMNSMEYYTTQLTRENGSLGAAAELRGNVTVSGPIAEASVSTIHLAATRVFAVDPSHMLSTLLADEGPGDDASWTEGESSSGPYAVESLNGTDPVNHTAPSLRPLSVSEVRTSVVMVPSAWPASEPGSGLDDTTAALPGDRFLPSSAPTDVYWFTTESAPLYASSVAVVLSASPAHKAVPTTAAAHNDTTAPYEPAATAVAAMPDLSGPWFSTEPSPNDTSIPPTLIGDEGESEEPTEGRSVAPSASATPDADPGSFTFPGTTTAGAGTSPSATSGPTSGPTTVHPEDVTGLRTSGVTAGRNPATTTSARRYLCSIDRPAYSVKVGFPSGATVGYAKSQIRDILKSEFNKTVELQVLLPPPRLVFRVVSGPVVYTAISVTNALQRSRRFMSVSPSGTPPDNKYQVHSVLQFVPSNVDVRACNFSERIEKGLSMAFAEVRRRAHESTNFTVHIVNITMAGTRSPQQPVNIYFAMRGSRGYLLGSEVTNLLLRLTMVEFSYYMGFPVLEIAEPFHYPELNTTQLLRSSWLRTVLLGVLDPRLGDLSFQAKMERQLAQLLREALGGARRVRRATTVGNHSVQVVSLSELTGADHPLEIVYFVEGPSGQRMPAARSAELLNTLDVQRAAIVLGHRVQGVLAQPVEKVASQPSDTENNVFLIVIGVVVPLIVVILIVFILYWKLCRTDKLEFQPDAMTSIQQRQKSSSSFGEPQTPLPQTHLVYSEEEEEEYEDEEEEEEEADRGKGYDCLTKRIRQEPQRKISTEEDEEEEDEEEEWATDEEEDDDEEDDDDNSGHEQMRKRTVEADCTPAAKPPQTTWREEDSWLRSISEGRRAKKELPPPTVKGFDFAKLHLGQPGKDDVMVVQEPGSQGPPLAAPCKDGLPPPEGREIPAPPKMAVSSVKASLSGRRRERISPSDGDSVVSDGSSGRESGEDPRRGHVAPSDGGMHARKVPISASNGRNRIGPPPLGSGAEHPSSTASIFEHVDRVSRSAEAGRRLPNKIQLIAMQPMAVPPPLRPTINGKPAENPRMNKEMQVALRHKSEIEHHRNKIRLRAKRKGHYDFPTMENASNGFGDAKDQGRIYQKARQQIDRILDPELHIPSIFTESKKGGRGRRSPRQRRKDQLSAGLADADRDHLITSDSDAIYRRGPGVSNVAFVSDPDQGSPTRSPSPSDDVFLGPSSPPRCHAPPPPPYAPPQPSIAEARQQMHSLLDDAFALVSPTSQGSAPGITLPGGGGSLDPPPGPSPPTPGSRAWGSSRPLPLSSFSGPLTTSQPPHPLRYNDLGLPPSLMHRQGLSSSFLSPAEAPGAGPALQPDSLYTSKGHYTDEQPLSARPRPVGGTAGSQLHHLTQVGLSSRISRGPGGQSDAVGWSHYNETDYSTLGPGKEPVRPADQMSRNGVREPSAPPAHQEAPGLGYPSAQEPLDACPPTHSSASLIKAIREELLRLSQKQAAVSGSYHS